MSSEAHILVHVGASCSLRDDARYRKQASSLLEFIEKGTASKSVARASIHDAATATRHLEDGQSMIAGEIPGVRSAHMGAVSDILPPPASNESATAKKAQLDTPVHHPLVQVGRTPAVSSHKTPSVCAHMFASVVEETPILHRMGHEKTKDAHEGSFETPPSTVLDSQPSHSSFKRAFFESSIRSSVSRACRDREEPQWKRARTESPRRAMQELWLSDLNAERSLLRNGEGQSSPIQERLVAADDGLHETAFMESSPSPPKLRAPLRHSTTVIGVGSAMNQSQDSRETPALQEDRAMEHVIGPETNHTCLHPHTGAMQKPSFASDRTSYLLTSSSSQTHLDASSLGHNHNLTLALAQQTALLRCLPSSELLVSAPRPPTSTTRPFTTHVTTALAALRSRLTPLPKYYAPLHQVRPIRPLERGFWNFLLPVQWPHELRATFWRRLRDHVQRGKAGFGTRLERILDGQHIGCSQEKEGLWQPERIGREEWRVWCWGEVHVEIWLLLYVDSGGAVRRAGMEWRDGVEDVIVRM